MKIEDFLDMDIYLSKSNMQKFKINIDLYKELIMVHNKEYIARKIVEYKEYFDNLFKEVDDKIKLDLNQRIAILTNEDYNLIIAGAGSGKTTTMIAKIRYLIECQKIKPNEIIAISFGRKNVIELEEKLNKQFKLGVKTSTFHRLGLDIISECLNKNYDIAKETTLYLCIQKYLQEELYKDKIEREKLLNFLIYYFDIDPEIIRFDTLDDYHKYKLDSTYETIKSNIGAYNKTIINKRRKIKRTIKSEYLRSKKEVEVANFLYLNNLDYEYEKKYKYIAAKGIYYHPDFTVQQGENIVYIEVLSTNQNGESTLYTKNKLETYNFNINIKKRCMESDNANLILVYSSYNDKKSPLQHLKEDLEKFNFVLNKVNDNQIYEQLMNSNKNSYFHSFVTICENFIQKCKINEMTKEDLIAISELESDNRNKNFIKIIIPIYEYYMEYLKNNNLIDFDDMILMAKNIVKNEKVKLNNSYKYIIVDEYQDISNQRFDLIKYLSQVMNSKIVAVGDDWQSIFGFAGSNVELFTKFKEKMGYAEVLKIQNTYRNAQELIDVAGEFVEQNNEQIKKTLKSNKHINKPIIVYSYNDSEKNSISKAKTIINVIGDILKEKKDAKILLLGRYGFDATNLIDTGLFKEINTNKLKCSVFPNADISFYTVHKAKGLEFEYVIIINAIDSKYGFPSKVNDDPIFDIFKTNIYENMAYAEERRLFYVALTRTKNSVSIIVPKTKPSPFVLEIKDNNYVDFKDDVIEFYEKNLENIRCPKCKAFLRKGFSNVVNDEIYYCTTEKEICGYMTKTLNPKLNIIKCPSCEDGYLFYKTTTINGDYLIGCSNYEKDNPNSCNFVMFVNPNNIKNGNIINCSYNTFN